MSGKHTAINLSNSTSLHPRIRLMHASTLSILGKSESTAEATSRFLAVTVSATGRSDELTDTET